MCLQKQKKLIGLGATSIKIPGVPIILCWRSPGHSKSIHLKGQKTIAMYLFSVRNQTVEPLQFIVLWSCFFHLDCSAWCQNIKVKVPTCKDGTGSAPGVRKQLHHLHHPFSPCTTDISAIYIVKNMIINIERVCSSNIWWFCKNHFFLC